MREEIERIGKATHYSFYYLTREELIGHFEAGAGTKPNAMVSARMALAGGRPVTRLRYSPSRSCTRCGRFSSNNWSKIAFTLSGSGCSLIAETRLSTVEVNVLFRAVPLKHPTV